MPMFQEGQDPEAYQTAAVPGARPPVAPEAPPPNPYAQPGKLETVAAAFRQDNPIVSVVRALDSPDGRIEPNFDPMRSIAGTKYEYDADAFLGARNQAEVEWIKSRMEQQDKDSQTLAASGSFGTVASLAAGLLDPTVFLPMGGAVRLADGGYDVLRTAAHVGGLSALYGEVSHQILEHTQINRPEDNELVRVGSSTLLGGILGGAGAALLNRVEKAALARALEQDRINLTKAAGLPPGPATVVHPTEPARVPTWDEWLMGKPAEQSEAEALQEFVAARDAMTSATEPDTFTLKEWMQEKPEDLPVGEWVHEYEVQHGDVFARLKERGVQIGERLQGYGRIGADHSWHAEVPANRNIASPDELSRSQEMIDHFERRVKSLDRPFAPTGEAPAEPAKVDVARITSLFETEANKARARDILLDEQTNQGLGDPLGRLPQERLFELYLDEHPDLKKILDAHKAAELAELPDALEPRRTVQQGEHGEMLEQHPGAQKHITTVLDRETFRQLQQAANDRRAAEAKPSMPPPDPAELGVSTQAAAAHEAEPGLPPSGRPVGAAATDVRTGKPKSLLPDWARNIIPPSFQNKAAQWLLQFSPTQRTFFARNSTEAQRAMMDLIEIPFDFEDAAKGITTTRDALAPVGRQVWQYQRGMFKDASDKLQTEFNKYLGVDGGLISNIRTSLDDFTGRNGEKLSLNEFKTEVSKALRDNDEHPIPEVAAVAKHIRERIFDPLKQKLVEAGLLDNEDIAPTGDPSWLYRVYNKQAIAAKRPEFQKIITDWLQSEQADKAASQERVTDLADRRQAALANLTKVERRLEVLSKREAESAAQTKERVVELNAADRRAAELAERATNISQGISDIEEFIAAMRAEKLDPTVQARMDELNQELKNLRRLREESGHTTGEISALETKTPTEAAKRDKAIAERALGKTEAKAGEAEIPITRSEARFEELRARANAQAMMRDLLETARNNGHAEIEALTQKLEEEVGKWRGKSSKEAVSALKTRAEAERIRNLKIEAEVYQGKGERLSSADDAVNRAVRRMTDSAQDLSRQELADRANEIIDRILGSPDGRLPYDAASAGSDGRILHDPHESAPRGALKGRPFAIPSKLITDFLENDIQHNLHLTLNSLLPDLFLHQRFGDIEMKPQMRKINEEYAAKSAAATSEKQRLSLERQRQGSIRDLAAVRDRVRNIYGYTNWKGMPTAARVANIAKMYNSVTDLGSSVGSSLPDMAGVIMRFGLERSFRSAWAPFLNSMMSKDPQSFTKLAMRQAKAMRISLETELNLRGHTLADIGEHYRPGSTFERGLRWMADKTQLANFQAPWTDVQKTIAGTVAVDAFMDAISREVAGKATARDVELLAHANIDAGTAQRIWKQFHAPGGGDKVQGVYLTNLDQWTDRGARDAIESAVAREADIAVVTPGHERPLVFSNPILSMLMQFKSFTGATHERLLIPALQRRDAASLAGIISGIGLGMMSYKLYSLITGRPTSDRPQDWVKEGMARASTMGWIDEANNSILSKLTGGKLDIYRAIGADKPLSKFVNRDAAAALLGPTMGKLQGAFGIGADISRGTWTAADTAALRRWTPGQNLIWLRNLLNEAEHGINAHFGIPEKPPH